MQVNVEGQVGTQPTVLVCEDDEPTLEFLADNLRADRFRVLAALTGQHARTLLERNSCDALILDVVLPDACGYKLCECIRSGDGLTGRVDPNLPILMLSGRGSEYDRVRGLKRGADDYLAKPFHYEELLARLEALLRRTRNRSRAGLIKHGKLTIDPAARTVRIGERRVELSAKEFAFLRHLASDPNRVFTKRELLESVWEYKSMGSTRTLDSHASRLRKKLNGDGQGYVINVWGVGYRLMDGPC